MKAINPTVTVCVTTFNRPVLLKECINSIIKQSFTDFEIIIIDDNSSSDNSYITELDERIIYIKNEHNKGLVFNRNLAINISKGKYFTFIDDDDLWEENFLITMLSYAENLESKQIICAQSLDLPLNSFVTDLKKIMLYGFTPPVGSQFYLQQDLLDAGGYTEGIRSGVDHDLWFKLSSLGYSVVWINRSLVIENANPFQDRITTNYNERLKNISESILTWKKNYAESFPDTYWDHLFENYRLRAITKHLKSLLKKGKYFKAISLVLKAPKFLLFEDLAIKFLKKRFKLFVGFFIRYHK
ncbi:glycosyltransferase family 2 protein [Vibrio splendidus]